MTLINRVVGAVGGAIGGFFSAGWCTLRDSVKYGYKKGGVLGAIGGGIVGIPLAAAATVPGTLYGTAKGIAGGVQGVKEAVANIDNEGIYAITADRIAGTVVGAVGGAVSAGWCTLRDTVKTGYKKWGVLGALGGILVGLPLAAGATVPGTLYGASEGFTGGIKGATKAISDIDEKGILAVLADTALGITIKPSMQSFQTVARLASGEDNMVTESISPVHTSYMYNLRKDLCMCFFHFKPGDPIALKFMKEGGIKEFGELLDWKVLRFLNPINWVHFILCCVKNLYFTSINKLERMWLGKDSDEEGAVASTPVGEFFKGVGTFFDLFFDLARSGLKVAGQGLDQILDEPCTYVKFLYYLCCGNTEVVQRGLGGPDDVDFGLSPAVRERFQASEERRNSEIKVAASIIKVAASIRKLSVKKSSANVESPSLDRAPSSSQQGSSPGEQQMTSPSSPGSRRRGPLAVHRPPTARVSAPSVAADDNAAVANPGGSPSQSARVILTRLSDQNGVGEVPVPGSPTSRNSVRSGGNPGSPSQHRQPRQPRQQPARVVSDGSENLPGRIPPTETAAAPARSRHHTALPAAGDSSRVIIQVHRPGSPKKNSS